MQIKSLSRMVSRLPRSKKALAIPVTFFVLFISMLGVIAVTYYFSIDRVTARSQYLKVSMAKQSMISFDEDVLAVLNQPGSSQTLEFDDYGGRLNVQSLQNPLIVGISDGYNVSDTIFNATVGQVIYELPFSESPDTGLFLKGDSRTIINQSGSQMTQLYIAGNGDSQGILLRYRPLTSYIDLGTQNNETVGTLRILVVNLNTSQTFDLLGQVPLKISCVSVDTIVRHYNVSHQLNTLTVSATTDGVEGHVNIPVSSTVEGAIIDVHVVVCNIKVERWVR